MFYLAGVRLGNLFGYTQGNKKAGKHLMAFIYSFCYAFTGLRQGKQSVVGNKDVPLLAQMLEGNAYAWL